MRINGAYTVSARLEAWRGGALYRVLRADQISIRMSGDAEIKVTLSCRIDYDGSLDLLSDRLRPYQIINGEAWPMGEFIVSTASEVERDGGHWWEVEAYDQTLLLRQATTIGALRFAAGTTYLDAAKSLLADVGIGRVIASPSSLTIAEDLEDWEIGTSYLSIINDLLSAIGYRSIWFDRNGAARLSPAPAAVVKNLTHSYAAGEWSTLANGVTRQTDAYAAYNVFTAVYSPTDGEPMVATAVNSNPLSPLSTVRRGRRICAPVEVVDDISSQEALQAYADAMLSDAMMAVETVEFETAPVPSHWIGEVVALSGQIYAETGWEITLGAGGSYTHTAQRSVAI